MAFYFHILTTMHGQNHIKSNGLFYPVLLHIQQLGSQLAFYELIYVRPVFLN